MTTRGGLVPAQLINETDGGAVNCHFNPYEYTLTKKNSWEKKPVKGKNLPQIRFKQGNPTTLKLRLYFDTLDSNEPVSKATEPLWKMMMVTETNKHQQSDKSAPPEVAFEWGTFRFLGVIVSLSEKFTLFDERGVPKRCEINITMEEIEKDFNRHITPSATPAPRAVRMMGGDRIDNVAASGTNSSSNMREIAEANNLDNPLRIPAGSNLNLPST